MKISKIIARILLIISACFNSSCSDIYGDAWKSVVSDKYRLSIIETSSTLSNRILLPGDSRDMELIYNSSSPTDCRAARIADFNNDKKADILFIYAGGNSKILYPTGNNNYREVALPVTSSGSYDGVTADFDNDGDTDIFIISNMGNYYYLRNEGKDSFTLQSIFITLSDNNGVTVSASDFDGDGDIDVLIGASDSVQLFTNNLTVDGTFIQSEIATGLSTITDSVTGDLDDDGDNDAVIVYAINEPYSLFTNNGKGVFTEIKIPSASQSSSSVSLGDLDSDGDLDMYVTSVSNQNQIVTNNGNNEFTVTPHSSALSSNNYAGTIGDIDLDGNLDIIVSNSTGTFVYLNKGKGKFTDHCFYQAFSGVSSVSLGAISR